MTEQTNNVRVTQIALATTDPNKFQLLKTLAEGIKKAQSVDKRFKPAKKSCTKCYGRGFVGYLNGLKNLPVPCRCTFVKQYPGKRKSE
jgi:hypothetical protein